MACDVVNARGDDVNITEKQVRRMIVDRVANMFADSSDSDTAIVAFRRLYGDLPISTAMSRLVGNCSVTYDFAEENFPDRIVRRKLSEVSSEHVYSSYVPTVATGRVALWEVLDVFYAEEEPEYRERPIYEAEWDGYEYVPRVVDHETDYDNPIEGSGRGRWRSNYESEMARAIGAVIGSKLYRELTALPVDIRRLNWADYYVVDGYRVDVMIHEHLRAESLRRDMAATDAALSLGL